MLTLSVGPMAPQYQSSSPMTDFYTKYPSDNCNYLADCDNYSEITTSELTDSSGLSSSQVMPFNCNFDAFFEEPRFMTESSYMDLSSSSNISSPGFSAILKKDPSPSMDLFDFDLQGALIPSPPPSSPSGLSSASEYANIQTTSNANTVKSPAARSSDQRTAGTVANTPSKRSNTQRRRLSSKSTSSNNNNNNNTSSTSPASTKPQDRRRKARLPHNLVEQRYRDTLNYEIKRLQMAIPYLAGSQEDDCDDDDGDGLTRIQPTKAIIIASAVQYIKSIENERDAALLAINGKRGPDKQSRRYS
jgi:hypothetical protein